MTLAACTAIAAADASDQTTQSSQWIMDDADI